MKQFVDYTEIRDKGFELAWKLYQEDFIPDVMYVVLRGGAYLGNILSECFKFFKKDSKPVYYDAVVARSYKDINVADRVVIEGWTYAPSGLRKEDKILIVDDIFDTGRTVGYIADEILKAGVFAENIKIAVFDYKKGKSVQTGLFSRPDYYCREIDKELWTHYLGHELEGLTEEEIHHYYDFPVAETIRKIISVKS